MCPLLQSPTSAPSPPSCFLSIIHLPPPCPLPPFPPSHPLSSPSFLHSLHFCTHFSSFLLLFCFLNNSSSSLLPPSREKLPLSQAKTINQSLVSLALHLYLSQLLTSLLSPRYPALLFLLSTGFALFIPCVSVHHLCFFTVLSAPTCHSLPPLLALITLAALSSSWTAQ